jgi:outer membrane lipoprotein-sorting protein
MHILVSSIYGLVGFTSPFAKNLDRKYLKFGVWCLSGAWMLVLGAFCTGAAPSQSASQLSVWLSAQTNIQSWSADFIQTRALKSLTQPLTSTGHVWFAQPNRFRWEMRYPAQTTAVRAGDEVLLFYPKLKRVERYPLGGDQTGQWRDALALLEAGFPRSQADLESRFRVLSQTVTNQICELTLQPRSAAARKMMPQIRIAFSITDSSLKATELQFADGSIMRNDFINPMLNPTLVPDLFTPKIQPDFKVIEPLKK